MIQSCVLDTAIAPSYFRNNRSTRQKSLRCFPACSLRGHVSGGFCGQSLRANIILTNPTGNPAEFGANSDNVDGNGSINNSFHNHPPLNLLHAGNNSSAIDINEYLFIAEIRPANKTRISGQNVISKTEIMNQIRTKVENKPGAQSRELFLGEVSIRTTSTNQSSIDLNVVFNSQHHSWDYSWRSNRWSATNEKHVVDIIVLRYNAINSTDFMVSACYTSNPFYIISSHKKPGQKLVSSDMEVIDASRVLSNLAEIGSDNQSESSSVLVNGAAANKRKATGATATATVPVDDNTPKDEVVIMSSKKTTSKGDGESKRKKATAKGTSNTEVVKEKEENLAESAQTLINMSMLVQPLNYEYDSRNNATGSAAASARTATLASTLNQTNHADSRKRKVDNIEHNVPEYSRMVGAPLDPTLFNRIYGGMIPNLYSSAMAVPDMRGRDMNTLGRMMPVVLAKPGDFPSGHPNGGLMASFPPGSLTSNGMFLSGYPGLPINSMNVELGNHNMGNGVDSTGEGSNATEAINSNGVIVLPGRN